MIICPVCGKESRDDYCIFCMRPIVTKEAERYNAQKELSLQYIESENQKSDERDRFFIDDDMGCEIAVKKRKPLTLKRIALFLLLYNIIITIIGIAVFLLDIYLF